MRAYDEILNDLLKEGTLIRDGKKYTLNPLTEELLSHPEHASRVAEGERLIEMNKPPWW